MKQNDIQNMSGVGPGNTEANDAVMRPFVILSPTFTSSESLSRGPPPTQKVPPGFRPSLDQDQKEGVMTQFYAERWRHKPTQGLWVISLVHHSYGRSHCRAQLGRDEA